MDDFCDPLNIVMTDPIIVDFPGMTPGNLGPRFARVLHCVRRAAAIYAPDCHETGATYDPTTHIKTGYAVTVPNKLAAARVRLCYELALQCRPMPWAKD